MPLAADAAGAGGAGNRIGFFLHIPYPNIALLRVLPVYAELVRDSVPVRSDRDFRRPRTCEGFQSAVNSVFAQEASIGTDQIELAGRRVRTGVFPIGVDVEEIATQSADGRAR